MVVCFWRHSGLFALLVGIVALTSGDALAEETAELADADWRSMSLRDVTEFGPTVSDAGDVNGDGYADVIVGSEFYDNESGGTGRVDIYHGSEEGLEANPAWTSQSDQLDAYFGTAVAGVGDVNGDGFDDVIVGASNEAESGKVYVYHGSGDGLQASPAWTAESTQDSTTFGKSVSGAGDVNGDGYADVIVGDPFYDGAEQNSGRAHVYLGSADGLEATPSWIADDSDQDGAFFGWSVSTAGDVNGDGYADVVVGVRRYSDGEEREGRAHVYYGSEEGLEASPGWTVESDYEAAEYGLAVSGAGDVDGDGYADVIVGAWGYSNSEEEQVEGHAFVYHGSEDGLETSAAWTGESNEFYAHYGAAVSGAGDLNGDGFADVIIGAPEVDTELLNVGQAYVYYGSESGLADSAAQTIIGEHEHSKFAWAVSGAGDVNADGVDDVMSSVRHLQEEGSGGGAYVFYSEPAESSDADAGADAGPDVGLGDAGADAGAPDAGGGSAGGDEDGCGCSSAAGPRGTVPGLMVLVVLGFARLRRRAPDSSR